MTVNVRLIRKRMPTTFMYQDELTISSFKFGFIHNKYSRKPKMKKNIYILTRFGVRPRRNISIFTFSFHFFKTPVSNAGYSPEHNKSLPLRSFLHRSLPLFLIYRLSFFIYFLSPVFIINTQENQKFEKKYRHALARFLGETFRYSFLFAFFFFFSVERRRFS